MRTLSREKRRVDVGGWGRQVIFLCVLGGVGRETRDWWPLLTVETKANGTLGVHMKEVFPWFPADPPQFPADPPFSSQLTPLPSGRVPRCSLYGLKCFQQYAPGQPYILQCLNILLRCRFFRFFEAWQRLAFSVF
jgi:hypothetical protein